MRVAIDGEPLIGPRTGIGKFCEGLLGGLAALAGPGAGAGDGLDLGVYAVTWRMRPQLAARLPAGVPLLGRPMPARPVRALWDHGLRAPLEWFTGPLDVVHGTNFVVPPTRRAARVVSVHDLTPLRFPEMCQPETLVFPDFIRRAVEEGAWVHTDSAFVAAEVVEAFGADPDRVRAVHPGVPALDGARPAARAAPAVGPFERYILAIGTVEPRKDYPGLVRAFGLLAADRPELGLVIAGRDGWGAESFRAAVDASPVRDRVRQMGYVDDEELGDLLAGAAVLAYPSRYEGFGFPPLQAMAAGVPVVATSAGSVPEVVGAAAVTVAPGDVDGLAAALAMVVDDRARAAELVRVGTAHAAAFSWERCATGMLQLYRDARSA